MMRSLVVSCVLGIGCASSAQAATLRVGPTRALKAPSAAAAIVNDGDVVLIDAGTYVGDTATWRANRLTLRGVGGRAHLRANGQSAQGKAIWVIAGNRTTVENIEFSGATVADANGAGIRQEGAGLIVRRCSFHDNENGILTGANPLSDILIEYSSFADNGIGDGQTHNIYIGAIRTFRMRFSRSVRAKVGHEIKSRAALNDIRYNILDDGSAATSYSIDLPNGGESRVVGNLIVQGVNSENTAVISYGFEGLSLPSKRLWISHNTIVNRIVGRGTMVQAQAGAQVAVLNTAVAGDGVFVSGAATWTLAGNRRVSVLRFKPYIGSPLVNRAVTVATVLTPRYVPAGTRRVARIRLGRRNDIGAFERRP